MTKGDLALRIGAYTGLELNAWRRMSGKPGPEATPKSLLMTFRAPVDSPRLRFAGRPSLRLRRIEGGKPLIC